VYAGGGRIQVMWKWNREARKRRWVQEVQSQPKMSVVFESD